MLRVPAHNHPITIEVATVRHAPLFLMNHTVFTFYKVLPNIVHILYCCSCVDVGVVLL